MGKLIELIREMRAGLEGVTPGPWRAGHLADDSHSCNCRHIFDGFRMGCIADVKMGEDGDQFASEYPSPEEAKANLAHLSRCSPENIAKLLDAAEASLQQPGGWQDEPHRQRFKSGVRAAIAWLHHRATYEMNDPHAKAILNTAAYNLGNDLAQNQLKPATPPHSGSSGQTGEGK